MKGVASTQNTDAWKELLFGHDGARRPMFSSAEFAVGKSPQLLGTGRYRWTITYFLVPYTLYRHALLKKLSFV